ncbi:MAG: YihY/virulence factor BrkB family protein [Clostridia bacterium]|nr:YihY/virulence factor BrkB family protein [Lachnospiraceae bacterium]MBQ8401412.1 YihY/virulence factor BrkB family protein [Clostridia bacterium]
MFYRAYFPNASYIYGGLAAVCLIMLWIYFCTIILLLGAEVNKLYFLWREKRILCLCEQKKSL